jgi:hypothetical protein
MVSLHGQIQRAATALDRTGNRSVYSSTLPDTVAVSKGPQ